MPEISHLDWSEIRERLAGFATCELSRQELRQLTPLRRPEEAESSFSQIFELIELLKLGKRPFAESLDLFAIWHQRLSKQATLKTLELKDVRHFCLEIIALKELLKPFRTSWIVSVGESLMNAEEPLSAIDQLMTPDGDIRSDASETLYALFNEKNQLVRQVQNILDKLIRLHELEPVLQDRYVTNREGRWVLPVKSGRQHQFEGIIHASSQTKQTVFMEPKDIIPLNNRLRQVEVDIEEEIERLLSELSKYLFSILSEIGTGRDLLLQADIRLAEAQLAFHMQGQKPTFVEDEIFLDNLRHPLLILNNEKVVANSVRLNKEKRILLLSGPNAGGKTVLLKSVGLAAQMARCGLLIAASADSKLPFFTDLHVAVGDAQSVDQHLSTFAAHIQRLNAASLAQGPGHLLLIDEICGSTDPEEGTALARAFIETFADNRVFGVVTSHLGPLKSGWTAESGVINGSLEYDSQSGRPTYHFMMGVPGQSLAIQTARRVGATPALIEKAMHHLSPEMKRYNQGLEEVEEMKTQLRVIREELETEKREARAQKSQYEALRLKFEVERDKMLDHALKQAEKKVDALIENIKAEDVFRRHERLAQVKVELPEVIKGNARPEARGLRIETAEDFAKAFPPGARVFAPSVGKDAVVQGTPNSKGEVPVLAQSMRLLVHWEHLKPPQHAMNPTVEVVRRAASAAISPLEQERHVDVRGLSVEEAIRQLETQLDTAVLQQEDRIKIVHGHGTDTLKKAIRTYLSRSVYVKKWKAGTPESGGDGVTWAELT